MEIEITQKQVLLIDENDVCMLRGRKPFAQYSPRIDAYYVRVNFPGGYKPMLHRLIMGLGRNDHRQVDHINRNPLDNRRENLRVVSASENQFNKRLLFRNNTSGYKGVSLHKKSGRYSAFIQENGKRRWLGYSFKTAEDAARAVHQALNPSVTKA